MYRPGELRERIKLKRITSTNDGIGGQTETLITYAETWAKVKPLRGRELYTQDQVQTPYTNMFVIRSRDAFTVDEADSIEWNGKDYNIRQIAEVGNSPLYLELYAERGVAL